MRKICLLPHFNLWIERMSQLHESTLCYMSNKHHYQPKRLFSFIVRMLLNKYNTDRRHTLLSSEVKFIWLASRHLLFFPSQYNRAKWSYLWWLSSGWRLPAMFSVSHFSTNQNCNFVHHRYNDVMNTRYLRCVCGSTIQFSWWSLLFVIMRWDLPPRMLKAAITFIICMLWMHCNVVVVYLVDVHWYYSELHIHCVISQTIKLVAGRSFVPSDYASKEQ